MRAFVILAMACGACIAQSLGEGSSRGGQLASTSAPPTESTSAAASTANTTKAPAATPAMATLANATATPANATATPANATNNATKATGDGPTCFNLGTKGPRSPRAFVCPENMHLNATVKNLPCPGGKCTIASCCEKSEPVPVIVMPNKPESNTTMAPVQSNVTGSMCGAVVAGSRPARFVCHKPLRFNEEMTYAKCPKGGCTKEMCCLLPPLPGGRRVPRTRPSPPAEKPGLCAFGAGILDPSGEICCHRSCGKCGGIGCFARGGAKCCKTLIRTSNRPCSHFSAPCANHPWRPVAPSGPFGPPMEPNPWNPVPTFVPQPALYNEPTLFYEPAPLYVPAPALPVDPFQFQPPNLYEFSTDFNGFYAPLPGPAPVLYDPFPFPSLYDPLPAPAISAGLGPVTFNTLGTPSPVNLDCIVRRQQMEIYAVGHRGNGAWPIGC